MVSCVSDHHLRASSSTITARGELRVDAGLCLVAFTIVSLRTWSPLREVELLRFSERAGSILSRFCCISDMLVWREFWKI